MITKINELKYICNFQCFLWQNKIPEFSKVNIIFGYNGSGKTVFSNVFKLFSTKEDTANLLFSELASNDSDASVEIAIDKKKIKYKDSCLKKDIYVFNSDFITKHVYDGTKANISEFDSAVTTKEQLTNPKIQHLEEEINKLEQNKTEEESQKEALDKKFEEIKDRLSREFNQNIIGKRVTVTQSLTIPTKKAAEIRKELDSCYQQYQLSKKQETLNKDKQILEDVDFQTIKIDAQLISQVLGKTISKVAREKVVQKLTRYSSFVPTKVENLQDWFEDGHSFLQDIKKKGETKCPLCDSDIQKGMEELLDEYNSYFSEEHKNLSQQIELLMRNIEGIKNLLSNNKTIALQLKNIFDRYESLHREEKNKDEREDFKLNNLETNLKSLKERLASKKNDLLRTMTNNDLISEIEATITNYNSQVEKKENMKDKLLEKLKQSFDSSELEKQAKEFVRQLTQAEFNEHNGGEKIEKYQEIKRQIEGIKAQLIPIENQRKTEVDSLKNESKYINDFLKKSGVHNFTVDIDKKQTQENIQIHYKNGCTRSKLKYSLSEGEKTALAFAYFLSLIKYEVFDNTRDNLAQQTIVVIDDPISSLDEERLYTTAYLISHSFKDVEQLFVLSHNLIFLKFFSNITTHDSKERQDYYLCNHKMTLDSLPTGLTNYTTVYFQKLHDIIEYQENRIKYDEVKKFIPNHIRVVLETFLSFKFAALKQGSSGEKYYSAGLDKLINNLKNKTHLFEGFVEIEDIDKSNFIEKLEKIKRITDSQSHGGPQSIDEFNFISENELKDITKDALNIIKYLDQIHFDSVKEKVSNITNSS